MDFRCNLESPKPASRPYSELTDAVTDMNLSGGLFGYSFNLLKFAHKKLDLYCP